MPDPGPEPGPGGLAVVPVPVVPVRLRLDLAYDGAEFAGWARQPGQRTVAGTVEDALARILRVAEPPRLTVAGRTDAGVHARGQVAHVDLTPELWERCRPTLPRRLAGLLPPDVRVWSVAPAPAGFDARFSAVSRRYAYRVCDFPAGVDPLRRHDVLWYPRPAETPLDLAAMNTASAALVGEHDFAAFCRRREGATTIRELRRLEWVRGAVGEDPTTVVATVEADAFCHSMVRSLMGALLVVGEGRRPVGWPAEVLAGGVRHPAVNVARPHGLTLEAVRYPPPDQLAERANEARRRRSRP